MCVPNLILKDLKQNEAQTARAESTHKGINECSKYVEFMYFVFTRMAGESYCGRLGSLLLYLGYVFRAQINSLCVLSLNFKALNVYINMTNNYTRFTID